MKIFPNHLPFLSAMPGLFLRFLSFSFVADYRKCKVFSYVQNICDSLNKPERPHMVCRKTPEHFYKVSKKHALFGEKRKEYLSYFGWNYQLT